MAQLGDLNINLNINVNLRMDPVTLYHRYPASRMKISIGDKSVPHKLNVDTTDESATVAFVDDHGNETSPPSGFDHLVWTSSDSTVLGATADPTNPLKASIDPAGTPGTGISLSCQAVQADGSPVLEADGVTPMPAASADDTFDVDPGAAVGERITVSGGDQPAPTP